MFRITDAGIRDATALRDSFRVQSEIQQLGHYLKPDFTLSFLHNLVCFKLNRARGTSDADSSVRRGAPVIELIIVLVIVGLCLYLVETYIPLSPPIKIVIRVVVVLVLVLWLLRVFGITDIPPLRLR